MDELTRLALRARAGDRRSLEVFVGSTQAEVWRLCAHLVDVGAADDLTQDTYLRAHRALGSFRGEASARTWLLSIARRACADAIRSRTRQRALVERLGHRRRDGGDAVAAMAGATELDLLIAELDEDRKVAFTLTQRLGLSYAEAAEICGCPVGTIRSRVARARASLVAALDGAGWATGG